jgi:GT2 family glycosyltransferase
MAGVDVVVVTHNSRDQVRTCVEALSGLDGIRVIVVDSASSDGTLAIVDDPRVTTVALSQNRGFAVGCNEGIRRGSAEFVLLLNPDAHLDAAGMRALVLRLEGESHIGAVGPRIVDEHGVLQYSIRRFPRARSSFAQALFVHRLLPHATWVDELVRDEAVYAHEGPVDWISGACILLRRTALEALGGLDEGFFLYREDADLCRRLHDCGYEVWFEPAAECTHLGGMSHPREALFAVLATSRIRYAMKHGGRSASSLERAGIVLGAATHALVGAGGLPARRGHLRALRVGLSPTALRARSGPP